MTFVEGRKEAREGGRKIGRERRREKVRMGGREEGKQGELNLTDSKSLKARCYLTTRHSA